ncbi:hypothetical protein ACQ4PT_057621 [Festuca glaucescens]
MESAAPAEELVAHLKPRTAQSGTPRFDLRFIHPLLDLTLKGIQSDRLDLRTLSSSRECVEALREIQRYDVAYDVVEVEGVTKEGSDETAKDQIEEKGVSDFWLNAMKNHEILADDERDMEALKYLKDIKCFRITEPNGFKLEFHFDTNPLFKNAVLTKTYQMIDEDEPIPEKAVGTKIEWYPGKCLTRKVLKKKAEKGSKNTKPNTKTETCESFFNFFSPPQVPDDDEEIGEDTAEQLQNQMEQDYYIGSTIRDKIIPHLVSWFTGEAAQEEDFELEDEEDEVNKDDDHSASCRPIRVIQLQHLIPLPIVQQEFFPCHLPPLCPEAYPGAGSMYLATSLPDDMLADVLCRLAPRGLAKSRSVCKSWRRVVDGHHLLRADLLPLSLGGIFLNFHDMVSTQFLSRPTTGAAVSGKLFCYTLAACHPDYDYVPYPKVLGHCNGLLLFRHCVVNPATRQWAPLPPAPDLPLPPPGIHFWMRWYLVFDPTLSPNYFDVLIMPEIPSIRNNECEKLEWPPYTLTLPVFSSKACSWEERTFRREGEAAGMLPDMVESPQFCNNYQCAYWRETLYVCCSCFVLRISLSDNTYRVIRLPPVSFLKDNPRGRYEFYLGKSTKGIYCASQPYMPSAELQVWFLDDLNEWVLKHDTDISPPNLNYDQPCDGPWILQEFDYQRDADEDGSVLDNNKEAMAEKEKFGAIVEEKFEWDSDNDNVLEPGRSHNFSFDFVGFHPYKEVVLLGLEDRVVAYHWSSSKIQDLGKLFPKFYSDPYRGFFNQLLTESFPYTPCWLGELPEKMNLEAML